VCQHRELARVELLRAGGASIEALTREFGLNRDSLYRHFANHISAERFRELLAGPVKVEKLAGAAADESRALLDYFSIARSVLFNQFLTCAEACDHTGVVNVSGRLLEVLREIGKMTGELRAISGLTINNNTLNLIASPEFLALQEGLLNVARAHPEARADIVALLRGLEPQGRAARGQSWGS
jgi:AcrR family transcriptional regulator